MNIVFNELSFGVATSVNQAKLWYDSFFLPSLDIERELKEKVYLVYTKNPTSKELHSDYNFSKWLETLEKNLKVSILSMLTNNLILHKYPYYKTAVGEGKGMGFAYENNILLASYCSLPLWENSVLDICKEEIDENSLEIKNTNIQVLNFSNDATAKFHYPFLKEKLEKAKKLLSLELKNGIDLLEKKEQQFPSLIFCDSVHEFVSSLSGNDIIFKNLVKRLFEYEKYFSKWIIGDFNKGALGGKPRPESSSREIDYSKELTIKCPDNIDRFFSMHFNFGNNGYRIHFFADTKSRKCYIGYIGRKIGT